jgi:hypothetical protein
LDAVGPITSDEVALADVDVTNATESTARMVDALWEKLKSPGAP